MKSRKYIWIQAIISLVIFAASFRLFYLQIVSPQPYISDTPLHLGFAVNGTGYSVLYDVLGWLIRISYPYDSFAVAALEALAVVATVFVLKQALCRYSGLSEICSFGISVGCVFMSSLYVPILQPYFYVHSLVTQPWHNTTYILMRLFAAVTIAGLNHSLSEYQSNFSLKNWLAISVPLTIATMIKPNFLIGFSLALLLFLIYDAVANRFSLSSLIQCVKMGTTVFLSLIVLYIQSKMLYRAGSGSGIVITLHTGFFALGIPGTVFKVIRSVLLPAIIVLYNIRTLEREEKFVVVQFMISFLLVVILRETGFRATHGNFYWGLFCSSFFLFAFLWAKLAGNYRSIKAKSTEICLKDKLYLAVCVLLSIWHIVGGIVYFVIVSMGSLNATGFKF